MVGKGKPTEPDQARRNVGTVAIDPAERRLRLSMYAQDTDRDAIHDAGPCRGTPNPALGCENLPRRLSLEVPRTALCARSLKPGASPSEEYEVGLPRTVLKRGIVGGTAAAAWFVLTACGAATPASNNGSVAELHLCSSAAKCQQAMIRVVGHHVLLPSLTGFTFASGATGVEHSKSGLIGTLSFRNSALAGLDVYAAGQIQGSDLSKCDGPVSTPVVTPGGRHVCWIQESNGYFATKYVSQGLLYQAYSSESLVPQSQDRAWALTLVDSYS